MDWTRVAWAVCASSSRIAWDYGIGVSNPHRYTSHSHYALRMDEWNVPSPRCPTWKQPSKNSQGGTAPQPESLRATPVASDRKCIFLQLPDPLCAVRSRHPVSTA